MTHHTSFSIEYQPQLVESAVLHVINGYSEEHRFREVRNKIYEMNNPDAQEAAFQSLHQNWFNRLDFGQPLLEVLDAWPILKNNTQRCIVLKAQSEKSIGAELYVADTNGSSHTRDIRTILIQLSPGMFRSTDALLTFLRHELMHIVDMVNPDFEYHPEFAQTEAGLPYDPMLQKRYEVLWNITIDGRLLQLGWGSNENYKKHWNLFRHMFNGERHRQKKMFEHYYNILSPTHTDIVTFAQQPEIYLQGAALSSPHTGRCSLCQFPATNLTSLSLNLPQSLIEIIHDDHPKWSKEDPICQQCLDLYESNILTSPQK